MNTVNGLLKKLETLVREEILTPTERVEAGTFVCFREKLSHGGFGYHQFTFEDIPKHFQKEFLHSKKGDEIGPLKILAVFDVWSDSSVKGGMDKKKPVTYSN